MKTKMIWIFAAFLFCLLAFSTANASYIGTVDAKNDWIDSVTLYLKSQDYILGEPLEGLTEIEAPGTNSKGFSITNNGTSGTWSAPEGVDFITVKGGTQYAVYEVGGLTSGTWDTSQLLNKGGQTPDLSHISFWKSPGYQGPGGGGGDSSAVPEPTTMALLFGGLGILGYNTFRKKFKRK